MTKTIKEYGAWRSPLSAADVSGASLRFGLVRCDEAGAVYWSEGRPAEKGRCAIMRWAGGDESEELLPPPYSARSRVHEYGGGEFSVTDNEIYFINAEDQDIYRVQPGAAPERIAQEPDFRFADIAVDTRRNNLIAVAERSVEGEQQPENLLVSIDLATAPKAAVTPLAEGNDFYANPVLDPAGEKLAWLAWDLPDMPWDSAKLYVSDIGGDGSLGTAVCIAGDDESAVFQPEWTGDGKLTFVWDKSGWASLYQYDNGKIEEVASDGADYSRPLWAFGMRSYARTNEGVIAAPYQEGQVKLGPLGGSDWPISGTLKSVDTLVARNGEVAALVSTDEMAPAVAAIGRSEITYIRTGGAVALEAGDISRGEPISFKNRDGEEVYGLYYPPANSLYSGWPEEKPPILFTVHGGPTGMGDRGLKLKTQYWTTRGFGVFDTDYSGSTGYGRAYMRRLDGLWGVKDVSDIADAAAYMVAEGFGDPDRLFITGSSAGGMTVLLALADHDIFAGGTCTYGVTDLAHLLKFTHKFEAGYLYRLMGVEPGDDDSPIFAERSPVNKADKIQKPLIFFQGLDDKVVPPEQSRRMVEALRANGVDVEYFEFEGEAHGFRQASTIRTVLEREYAFYKRLLGLEA